jgi:transcriptional regulator with XRE-family HTH domain
MSAKQLSEKLAQMELPLTEELVAPPPESIGLFILWGRRLRNWKQSTLANFAEVSVSTIERVERGEKVSDESLERIAQALGYERGCFATPRRLRSPEEAISHLCETWGHLEAVNVRPLRTQAQIRKLVDTHAYLVYRPDVDDSFDPEIESLVEWIDVASLVINSPMRGQDCEEGRRRTLYQRILDCVKSLEQRGVTVLCGIMDAPQDGLPEWKVALISVTHRSRDPGATKRRTIFVDRRRVELPPITQFEYPGT